jgi:hypothetical protein
MGVHRPHGESSLRSLGCFFLAPAVDQFNHLDVHLVIRSLQDRSPVKGAPQAEVGCLRHTGYQLWVSQFQKSGADPSSHSNQLAFAQRWMASSPASTVVKPSSEPLSKAHCLLYDNLPLANHSYTALTPPKAMPILHRTIFLGVSRLDCQGTLEHCHLRYP